MSAKQMWNDCPRVREIWSMSNLIPVRHNFHFNSFMDFMWHAIVVAKWEHDLVEKIVMISWVMWNNRNEVRNGRVKKNG